MSLYADHLKAHLATYKQNSLGLGEDGIWRGNGRTYPHILPEREQRLNILETIREEFWRYHDANKHRVALHTDFHHLNSSQACAFNLLYPWVARPDRRSELLKALALPPAEVVDWHFEHMPDQEERTSVDCYMRLASGACVLIEVKLTEEHFGYVVPKDSHRKKRAETYLPRLAGKARAESLDEAFFFLNYQLFRNLSHLDVARGDRLLLVLPRANTVTWLQGQSFLDHLDVAARGSVRLVAMEDLLVSLRTAASTSVEHLRHLTLFAEKYLPAVPERSGVVIE